MGTPFRGIYLTLGRLTVTVVPFPGCSSDLDAR